MGPDARPSVSSARTGQQTEQEVQAAGFMLEGESNALMNPGDNLTGRSGQGSSQIMLKFRKPR